MRVKTTKKKDSGSILAKRSGIVSKTTDSKGRVALGGEFANRAVIVERRNGNEIVIKLARVIPENEAWLYENPAALDSLRKGLSQARASEIHRGPNLHADAALAAKLED